MKSGFIFTRVELLVITLAALAALLAAYSDGEDERGAFYELEFFGSRVDKYYWEEEDK